MSLRLLPVVLSSVAGLLLSAPGSAQGSCTSCHIANDDLAIARGELRSTHLADYRNSPHFTARVGCEECHGGDATAFDSARAHQGIFNRTVETSPTNPVNLSATCGRCHTTIFAAYSEHRHYDLVLSGDLRAPSCATCHGEVASHAFIPAQRACTACHSNEPDAVAAALGPRGGELLALMREVGALRRKVEQRISKVRDPARRHDLEGAFSLADATYEEAHELGHGFLWDEWEAAIIEAQQGLQFVFSEIKRKR